MNSTSLKPSALKTAAAMLAFGAMIAIAACSNGNDTSSGCSQTTAALPVLVYPAPNATGITPALQFVAVYNLGGAGGYVTLTPTNGDNVLTGAQFTAASPGPLPSPAATVPAGKSVFSSAITPPLVSGDTYQVQFVHNNQPPCGPQQPSGLIGQFTVAAP